jgi:photosystem II stability/assembly factor-like uncharacterized protein
MRYPAVLCLVAISYACAQPVPLTGGLEWRLIGPHRGGRSVTAAGIPGTSTFFFGSVGGGIWKSVNAGEVWTPIFDKQHIASIGSIDIAASNPEILYAGSGEADIRSDVTFGDGVYKSTDGGKTWANVGLRDTRHIGRVLIHPGNPDIVFVAALGHAYGPNEERGVFRTKDGGATWKKILFKDADTGAIDLAFEARNPDTLYASLWQAKRPAYSTYPPIEGPGSGLYKSSDGGDTWHQLTGEGLPDGPVGRIGIAVAPSNPQRVYALIEGKDGGLFRSDDSGATWTRPGTDPRIRSRGWYFGGITVDPGNADIVYCPNIALYRSSDGGATFTPIKGAPGGDDYHFLWIDPSNGQHMALASDQGTVISLDGGETWSSWFNQPTAQFYHVSTDNQFPYWVYGAQQDSGTAAIASRTNFGSITFRDWAPIGAGESGAIEPDPVDPNIVYGGSTYGSLFRFDRRTGQSQDISPSARVSFGTEIDHRDLRFTWTSPLAFSPQNPKALYFGAQFVLRSADQGMSWQAISPDLTGNPNSLRPRRVEQGRHPGRLPPRPCNRLRRHRSAQARRLSAVPLSHPRLRQKLDEDHHRSDSPGIRQRSSRRPCSERVALRRNRTRRVRVFRRWRPLAIVATQPAGLPRARSHHSRQRSGNRHAWPLFLDSGRHLAATRGNSPAAL